MTYFLKRLTEPSTWAAIAAALAALGLNLDPGFWATIAQAGAGVAGLLGFVVPEAGKA